MAGRKFYTGSRHHKEQSGQRQLTRQRFSSILDLNTNLTYNGVSCRSGEVEKHRWRKQDSREGADRLERTLGTGLG